MESGTGELNNQGPTQPSNKSDLTAFQAYGTTEQWWRTNADLVNYYNYRAIVDCIHHYDIADGKNYFYYHNPVTNKWTVLPGTSTWCGRTICIGPIPGSRDCPRRQMDRTVFQPDLGNGTTTGIPALRLEHRTGWREVLDLLFNLEQTGMLIDEMASFVTNLASHPSWMPTARCGTITRFWFRVSSMAARPDTVVSIKARWIIPLLPAAKRRVFPDDAKMRNYITTRRNVITNQVLTSAEENLVPTTPVAALVPGGGGRFRRMRLRFEQRVCRKKRRNILRDEMALGRSNRARRPGTSIRSQ